LSGSMIERDGGHVRKALVSDFGETDIPNPNLRGLANPRLALDWIRRKSCSDHEDKYLQSLSHVNTKVVVAAFV
jgi:hypothetical protein